ncbi:hypothetical protein [Sphingorhabdus sp. SMR4y]|uniref:hypothetical protein n=1 Tax=Sphingorhabdus sp. SMR4y TaxID=2584094 RepID=UPI00164029CE|nr:hypothetical protein [Sphingorhabdus sp. SMR4y]
MLRSAAAVWLAEDLLAVTTTCDGGGGGGGGGDGIIDGEASGAPERWPILRSARGREKMEQFTGCGGTGRAIERASSDGEADVSASPATASIDRLFPEKFKWRIASLHCSDPLAKLADHA